MWCKALPDDVHRAKGIVLTPDGPVRLDVVQGLITLTPIPDSAMQVAGRIVVIGPEALNSLPGLAGFGDSQPMGAQSG
ncbi:GTP-binding protein [Pukyongiella litopenaei]|nr:GTP-binding protein [Pukyongiella litopenaei]